jgi:hemerythrin-like domain-containing protein
MKTLDVLHREHSWITTMATCLEALVARARATDQLPEPAYELLHLYESFADGRHQEKEEGVLFPELLRCANGQELRELEQLVADHADERQHLSLMRSNLLGAVHGEPGCVRTFASEARAYLDRHRSHMAREHAQLFPMARRLLTPEADARVVQGFEHIDGGSGDPAGIGERLEGLCRRAGIPVPPAA